MRINEIIKERRNLIGLTQEEIANYIGVSTPAVNKWEKGVTYPDITILAPLARLLKIDINTLLSFREGLSDKEIGVFTNELAIVMNEKGLDMGVEMAISKIKEYPNCHKLIINIVILLQGGLIIYESNRKKEYEELFEELLEKVLESEDLEIKNQATSILITKYLGEDEYDKAQNCINQLPNVNYDKDTHQGRLYIKSGELIKANKVFQNKLIKESGEIINILLLMIDISLKENSIDNAKYYAEVLEKTSNLYGLWEYNSYVGYLQVSLKEKDEEKAIELLEKLLATMKNPWDISKCTLYKDLEKKVDSREMLEKFYGTFIKSLKEDTELGFLKSNKRFLKIID